MIQEIVCNSLTRKDLLADIGDSSYYSGVTVDDFWRAVGARLAERRKKNRVSMAAIEQDGGPTNKTVQDIEAGEIRQLAKLHAYADKLGVDLIDIFQSVLTKTDDDDQNEELQFVIRQFKESGVKGRAAFVRVAELAEARQEPPLPSTPGGREGQRPETRREGTAAAKRRGAR